MTTLRRLIRGSTVLLVANVSAGVLHYAFQWLAARRLSTEDYGQLNLFMAYLGLGLTAGSLAQFASNFREASQRLLRTSAIVLGVASAGVALLVTALAFRAPAGSAAVLAWVLAGISVPLAVAYYALLGQLQIRTAFAAMGVAALSLPVVKIAYPVATSASHLHRFYLAFPLSFGAATAFVAVWIVIAPPRESGKRVPASPLLSDLLGSGILAFSFALVPQLDLLNLRRILDDHALGQFAQASLFAKAVFFGALTLLQVTLPFHIAHERGSLSPAEFARIRLLERLGVAACVAGSIAFAALAGPISRRALGADLGDRWNWVLLSSLSLTALYRLLQQIQLAVAGKRPREAVLLICAAALTLPITWLVHPANGTLYLAGALVYYVALSFVPLGRWTGEADAALSAASDPSR